METSEQSNPSDANPTHGVWIPQHLFERQTEILSSHERQIARHTAIQTWIAAASTLFSLVTAVILGIITYYQYSESHLQRVLEYAKTSPSMRFRASPHRVTYSESDPIERLAVYISPSVYTIERVELTQRLVLRGGSSLFYPYRLEQSPPCAFTIHGYFNQEDKNHFRINADMLTILEAISLNNQIHQEAVWRINRKDQSYQPQGGRSIGGTSPPELLPITIADSQTTVRVTYSNADGTKHLATYKGRGGTFVLTDPASAGPEYDSGPDLAASINPGLRMQGPTLRVANLRTDSACGGMLSYLRDLTALNGLDAKKRTSTNWLRRFPDDPNPVPEKK